MPEQRWQSRYKKASTRKRRRQRVARTSDPAVQPARPRRASAVRIHQQRLLAGIGAGRETPGCQGPERAAGVRAAATGGWKLRGTVSRDATAHECADTNPKADAGAR